MALVQSSQTGPWQLIGFKIIEGFGNWTPPAGSEWIQYGGRWRNAGDAAPTFSVFGEVVYINEQEPPGFAFHSTYITGPDQPMPTYYL